MDASAARCEQLRHEITRQRLSNMQVFHMNALHACSDTASMDSVRVGSVECAQSVQTQPPFAPRSFDRVLLDAPCSGRGQRPLTAYDDMRADEGFRSLQKRLLTVAFTLCRHTLVRPLALR